MLTRRLRLGLALVTVLAVRSAAAVTFVVDTTADVVDATPGDGLCRTAGGQCSLRAAIQEANASPVFSSIQVTLPAGDFPLTLTGAAEDAAATGDLDITLPAFSDLTITGAGAESTLINALAADRVFDICLSGFDCVSTPVTLRGIDIHNGHAAGDAGGGIRSRGLLHVENCVVAANVSEGAGGGGIYNRETGQLFVTDSTVSGNATSGAFGGGGILNHLGAIATLTGSTVLENLSTGAGGGGITNVQADLRLHSSTVSNNDTTGDGGGILNYGGTGSTQLRLSNVTISENDTYGTPTGTGYGGGGLTNLYTGTVILQNSVLAGNVDSVSGNTDCAGTPLDSFGYNLIASAAGCFLASPDATTLFNQDPMLDVLADYGGPTKTYRPLPGSPVLDAGDPTAGSCDPIDQRGVPRPRGARCDIGAVEASVCGDTQVDVDEACDDGNAVGGDCCDATCRNAAPNGTACSDGDICTNRDRCIGGTCVGDEGPLGLCTATYANRGAVLILKKKGGTKDSLKWTLPHGSATMLLAFGDPTSTTPYTVCLYDRSGPGGQPRILLHADAPAGGTCAGKPCWKAVGTKGFDYKDKNLDPNGLSRIQLRAGIDDRAKVVVLGKGPLLAAPVLPLVSPVAVELRNGDPFGACWVGYFSTPLVNTTAQYKAKGD